MLLEDTSDDPSITVLAMSLSLPIDSSRLADATIGFFLVLTRKLATADPEGL